MIIYEKENKLNINFDNSTEAQPDVVISKEDGQVNIEAGGQPIGGGSEPFVVTFSGTNDNHDAACDKTWEEISQAYNNGKIINVFYYDSDHGIMIELTIAFTIEDSNVVSLFCKDYSFDMISGNLKTAYECVISADEVSCEVAWTI